MNRERIELLSTTTQPFTGVPRKAACGDGGIMSLMRKATDQSKLPPGDDPLDKLDDEVQDALANVNADEMAQRIRCRAAIQTAPHLGVRAVGDRKQGTDAQIVAVARPRERGRSADGIAAPVEAAGA